MFAANNSGDNGGHRLGARTVPNPDTVSQSALWLVKHSDNVSGDLNFRTRANRLEVVWATSQIPTSCSLGPSTSMDRARYDRLTRERFSRITWSPIGSTPVVMASIALQIEDGRLQ